MTTGLSFDDVSVGVPVRVRIGTSWCAGTIATYNLTGHGTVNIQLTDPNDGLVVIVPSAKVQTHLLARELWDAHVAAIQALADSDADTLETWRPPASMAFEVCRDRSADEAPCAAEIAIEALGEEEAARVYSDRWDVIEDRRLDEKVGK